MSLSYKGTVSEDLKTIEICVDSYTDRQIKGIVYHKVIPSGYCFDNLMQLLLQIERILAEINFPLAGQERRSFVKKEISPSREMGEELHRHGELATFYVRISFRQNASWQGTVTWCEGGNEESFRSALELLLLMDSALSADE